MPLRHITSNAGDYYLDSMWKIINSGLARDNIPAKMPDNIYILQEFRIIHKLFQLWNSKLLN